MAAELREDELAKQEELGFDFEPVKRQGLAASAGTTDFNSCSSAFSFFIIAAALMLVVLLFRLGVEQRASEVGILLAVGLASLAACGRAAGRRVVGGGFGRRAREWPRAWAMPG